MHVNEIKCHTSIGLMGLGNVFLNHHEELEDEFVIYFVTDNHGSSASRFPLPQYRFVSPDNLGQLEDPFVIVTTSDEFFVEISKQLAAVGIPHCHFSEIKGIDDNYPVVHLGSLKGDYADHLGNVICWEGGVVPDTYVHFGMPRRGGHRPIKARNNRLTIGAGSHFEGACHIVFTGSGSSVQIGANNWVGGEMQLSVNAGSSLQTGRNCTFESLHAVLHEGRIRIGNDCMFSVNVNLRQTDGHPIFDAATGQRINFPRDIQIGNHVWVGYEAYLLAGCTIGDDCIVGARSVTSGCFPDGVILAGSPARVVRTGITWRKDELHRSPSIAHLSDCKRY